MCGLVRLITTSGRKLIRSIWYLDLTIILVFCIYFDHFLLDYDVGVHETLISIQFMS